MVLIWRILPLKMKIGQNTAVESSQLVPRPGSQYSGLAYVQSFRSQYFERMGGGSELGNENKIKENEL